MTKFALTLDQMRSNSCGLIQRTYSEVNFPASLACELGLCN